MLDLKLIREQPDAVAQRLASRGADAGQLIRDLLARDAERRRLVREGDDILVVTTKGMMIRFHAADVSAQGRNTWGVRIIGLEADDRVGSVARVDDEQAPVEAS